MHAPAERMVVVYGTLDCEDTNASRALLAATHVSYQYQDLNVPDAAKELDWILGQEPHKKPTIVIVERLDEDTSQIVSHIMQVPKDKEFFEELAAAGLVPHGITLEAVREKINLHKLALEKTS